MHQSHHQELGKRNKSPHTYDKYDICSLTWAAVVASVTVAVAEAGGAVGGSVDAVVSAPLVCGHCGIDGPAFQVVTDIGGGSGGRVVSESKPP